MKQKHLIAVNMLNPGNRIHASRSEWTLEITREPRTSCLDTWRARNELRDMQPAETRTINGVTIYRKNLAHQASRYLVNENWYKFDEVVAILEGRLAA